MLAGGLALSIKWVWEMIPEVIHANLSRLREEIAEACSQAGRSPDEIRILAATKGRNIAEIKAAIEVGITLIGENTVQEALSKFEFLPPNIEKHFIGHLQLNKAKTAVKLFDVIESIDSLELAHEISRAAQKLNKRMPILLQINPSGEATKHGLKPEDLFYITQQMAKLPGIEIKGLMAMMPYQEPETLRPYFRQMKSLFEQLKSVPDVEMKHLSMGMSNDFKVAIEEGSNLIRIGTVLFGP